MSVEHQLNLYAQLMEEVKVRIDCINHSVTGKTGLPLPIVREVCYLQLRMLCELLALSCLVAHGDIKSLSKSYSADDIVKKLARLRPHFYPTSCSQEKTMVEQVAHFHLEPLIPQPLSKDDLLSLYAKSHDHLHRGTLKKLLSSSTMIDRQTNLPEIVASAKKIHNMLNHHWIAISDSRMMICMLRNGDNNMKVQVAIADLRPPP